MAANLLNIIISGLIMGGIYALIAVGLNLQYGVGRVLNVSHGEFIMLGAFITYSFATNPLVVEWEVSPLLAMPIIALVLFILGYLIYQILFQYLRNTSSNSDVFSGRSLLASFGLMFLAQNTILIVWDANVKQYTYLNESVSIFGHLYAQNRLVALFFAVSISVVFYLFITRTRLGKAIRAAAEDQEMANIIGVNIRQVLGICYGLGATLAGLAGVLISLMFPLQAARGLEYTVIAIVVVVFGGLGSITGSLLGGFILGLVISTVNYFDSSLSLIAFYAIFMILLLVRPSGLFGRHVNESH